MPPRARNRQQRGQGQPPVPAQPPPPPDPTQDAEVFVLDVSCADAAEYIKLQTDRDRHCRRLAAIEFNGVPMTTGDNGSCYIVQLTHSNYQQRVKLLIRDRDQYLLAFQRGDGRWYRFSDLPVLGLDAEILHLESSHGELLRGPSSTTAVGPHALLGMFMEFLEFDGPLANGWVSITNELKRALHWATVMVCEGARFQTVRRVTSQAINAGENVLLEDVLWQRMRNWGNMSVYWVMCHRQEQTGQPVDPEMLRRMDRLDIHNFTDVRRELCMLLFDSRFL